MVVSIEFVHKISYVVSNDTRFDIVGRGTYIFSDHKKGKAKS